MCGQSFCKRILQHFALVVLIAAMVTSVGAERSGAVTATPSSTGSADVIVGGRDAIGQYDLYVASKVSAWQWRAVAALRSPDASDLTIGQQCVTGDGTYAVVVIAPRRATNSQAGMDAGGVGYGVNLTTGSVSFLGTGLSLAYFDPSCGVAEQYVLTGYSGESESNTILTLGDLAGGVQKTVMAHGEFTSAVPVGGGIAAAFGSRIEHLTARGWTLFTPAAFGSVPYDLLASAGGGLDLLANRGTTAQAWHLDGRGRVLVGTGRAGVAHISAGLGGENHLENVRPAGNWPRSEFVSTTLPWRSSLSLGGDAIAVPLKLRAPAGRSAAGQVTPIDGAPEITTMYGIVTTRRFPAAAPISIVTQLEGTRNSTGALAAQTATCAVPRGASGLDPATGPNIPDIQVPQPSGPMIDWALTQAASNHLVGTLGRPAGFDNLGLPAYAASTDFPVPNLAGGASGVTVPPQVMEGIFATESNWDQASFHAPRGMPGDPLISNYYGTDSSDSIINYANADCGYGVGQVTSLMTVGAAPLATQEKIAADYEENIAASEQILASFWNQLYAANITVNDGKPSTLEDWYLAIWAYNTGIHGNDGAGNYGLGWLNNPINPIYPPNRPEFLSDCYCDAATPNLWPYQERVFGWMDYPYSEGGIPLYQSATPSGQNLSIPSESTFCGPSDSCNPNGPQPYCNLTSTLHCWWHQHTSWIDCSVSGNCHREFHSVSLSSPEPQISDPDPPTCAVNRAEIPQDAVIVDTQATATNWNLAGCPLNPTKWANKGSFSVQFGQDTSGDPTGEIDWHQLGTGFGGHMWFTHPVGNADPAHTDTGTWTPDLSAPGQRYDIMVFIPAIGGTDSEATYTIEANCGGQSQNTATIDQSSYSNQWVDLGQYQMCAGSSLTLTNNDGDTGSDLAFDAAAFLLDDHLQYGGGPVMSTQNVHVIFWLPSTLQDGSAVNWGSTSESAYVRTLVQYFKDVSNSGLMKNLSQYGVGSGVTFGGAILDQEPYPTPTISTCSLTWPPSSNCVNDATIENVITAARGTEGWKTGLDQLYVVYTAPGESICQPYGCYPNGPDWPFVDQACAYHDWYHSGPLGTGEPVIYAALPYLGSTANCQHREGPNDGGVIDSEISVSSHEQMEAATDPELGSGWTDPVKDSIGVQWEIGDMCAWNYGSAGLDGGDGLANEKWNGHYYLVQTEWSNAASACVSSGPTPSVQMDIVPGSGAPGSVAVPSIEDATPNESITFELKGVPGGQGTICNATVATDGVTYCSGPIPVSAAAQKYTVNAVDSSGKVVAHTAFEVTP
jgi:hypothetical protein